MKKILIISEYIAPMQEIASVRWTKISKYLKKYHDVKIVILTNEKNYNEQKSYIPLIKKDYLLEKDMRVFDDYWVAKNEKKYKIYFKIKSILKKVKIDRDNKNNVDAIHANNRTVVRKIKEELFEIWRDVLNPICYQQVIHFLKEKEYNDKFDVVVSTYGPAWTHMIASAIKQKNHDIYWIADFRDVCVRDWNRIITKKSHKNFVKKYCSDADVIIRVNDRMKLFEKKGQRVVTIRNGFDPEEALVPLKPKKFYLVYTGFLYNGRSDLRELFHVLRELINEQKMEKEDIEIQYAGFAGDLFIGQACEWKMQKLIKDYGVIERKKALEMQQSAAVLLQACWNTKSEKAEWTGKMYEYMMAGKPIVYMVSGDEPYSLPSKLMSKLGGVCYEECRHDETFPSLKQYILEKYQEWKKTGNVTIQADKEYVSQFAYPQIAERVWDLIKDNN